MREHAPAMMGKRPAERRRHVSLGFVVDIALKVDKLVAG